MLINLEEGQRCSEVSRSLNLDSCGTALRTDVFLAVDVPLPWPKPVFDHPFLFGVAEFLETHSKPIRLLASVPENNENLTITSYELKGNGFLGKSFLDRTQIIFNPSNLLGALKKILDGKSSDELGEDLEEEQLKEVWICTQGSHDVCCGSEGTSLALEANMKLQDVKIRRVSHLGGHRFAPTAVTFPNGRMWSHLTMENLHRIFGKTPIEEELLKKCRGWSGSETGPEQMAEREGLNLYGWEWDKYERRTHVLSEGVSGTKVLVTGYDSKNEAEVSFDVTLEESGKTPALSCDKAGSIPNKWQTQYEIKKVNVHS